MIEDEKKMKMAVIAGASSALKYKSENLGATDEEAISHVTRETDKIISKLDTEA